ncbi:PadR family transcriptional regulator [soil metagenome]
MAFRGDLEALILGVVQFESLHGYEIAKRIKSAGSSALDVGEGQLYPALHRLEKDAYISATWVPQEGKPDRKVYQITDEGKGQLQHKREAWEAFRSSVNSIFVGKKGEANA